MEILITEIALSEISLPKKLVKEHPERQVAQIAKSIETYGFNDPVAIDLKGEIIEGAGRVLAARKLNLEAIPAIRLAHLTEAQKRAYRIAHNKITLNSGFDLDALREEFEAISKLDEALIETLGFEAVEIEDLLKLPELPDLGDELTETLENSKKVTCPHCGGQIHV